MAHPLARRAIAAYARGDLAEARRLAEERLAQAPDDEDATALLDDLALDDARAEGADDAPVEAAGAPSISDGFASVGGPPPVSRAFGDLRVDDRAARSTATPARTRMPPSRVLLVAAIHVAGAFVLAVLAVALLFARVPLALPVALLIGAAAALLGLLARALARRSYAAWIASLALQVALVVASAVAVAANPSPGAGVGLLASVVVGVTVLRARRAFVGSPTG